MAILSLLMLSACGNTEDNTNTDTNETKAETTVQTEPEATEDQSSIVLPDTEFCQVFKAPEGDYREIVYNYMLSMANYKWVAGEDFAITWKEQGDFGVNLQFKKGETYYGLPYSESRSSLEQFSLFVEEGGSFTSDTYYYEEIIGNHCSSSMGLAYQQLIDFPYAGSLKSVGDRRGVIKLIDGLEQPEGETTKSWYSSDVISLNGEDKIYTKMGRGDILGKFIKTSGHSRMVSKVEVFKTAAGKFVPSRSYVYCIEQTNAFEGGSDRKSTWWIDHKYTFKELIDTQFIPLTLEIFHNGESLEDAYIAFDAKNSPDTIKKVINGTVSSNFPLSYVRATVTDKDNKVVGEIYEYKFDKTYKLNLKTRYDKLNIGKLEAGTYTYTLHAGIGRGGCDIESFQFTID